jgi:hypothetical protein
MAGPGLLNYRELKQPHGSNGDRFTGGGQKPQSQHHCLLLNPIFAFEAQTYFHQNHHYSKGAMTIAALASAVAYRS